jgi:hypothetical protein
MPARVPLLESLHPSLARRRDTALDLFNRRLRPSKRRAPDPRENPQRAAVEQEPAMAITQNKSSRN